MIFAISPSKSIPFIHFYLSSFLFWLNHSIVRTFSHSLIHQEVTRQVPLGFYEYKGRPLVIKAVDHPPALLSELRSSDGPLEPLHDLLKDPTPIPVRRSQGRIHGKDVRLVQHVRNQDLFQRELILLLVVIRRSTEVV